MEITFTAIRVWHSDVIIELANRINKIMSKRFVDWCKIRHRMFNRGQKKIVELSNFTQASSNYGDSPWASRCIYIIVDLLFAQVGSIIPDSMGGLMLSHKTKQTLILIYIYIYINTSSLVELVTRVYKFGGGWNRNLLSTDKNLANHEHENAIILDECVYSHIWAVIRTSHAQIIKHQMKCTGLNHKHLKEPNQSNLSGRRPMPWIQVFGAQDSTLKGVPHFLLQRLWCMFSILCFPNYWTFVLCWLL